MSNFSLSPEALLRKDTMDAIRQIIAEELDKRFVCVTVGSERTEMPTFTVTQYNDLMNLYMMVHEEYQQLQKEYVALKADLSNCHVVMEDWQKELAASPVQEQEEAEHD